MPPAPAPRKIAAHRLKGAGVGFLLAAPLLILTVVAFLHPILGILLQTVDDRDVARILPGTVSALAGWDGSGDVPAAAFPAIIDDAAAAYDAKTLARAADRLNHERSGFRSLVMNVGRNAARLDRSQARQDLVALDPRWGEADTWRMIRQASGPLTPRYLLAALDLRAGLDGGIVAAPADQRIYVDLFGRTVLISVVVLVLCILLGYPTAYWMAHRPEGIQRILFYCVILPFWTSLLVRTGAWLVLLQKEGVVNGLLVSFGIVGAPLQLAYNRLSVYVVMTNILLPFMILPLYSVMKRIPPELTRAAATLGASPAVAFLTVYLPQSLPGVGAGSLLVFVLALGFYITPQLVGGPGDQMISNMIAYYATGAANWSMAGALATILVIFVLVLFPFYRRYLGFDGLAR